MAQTVDGAQQRLESYWLTQDHIDRRRLRFSRLNERSKTGQQDYRDIRPGLLDQTSHLVAIHLRHRAIGHDNIKRSGLKFLQAFASVGRGNDIVTVTPKER
jgi:hypothetical protein